MTFPTDINSILQRIKNIRAKEYAATRNYTNGAVSYLSPYISRGVISLSQVKNQVLQNFSLPESEKFIQELAWREYWQRVWQAKGDEILQDIKTTQSNVRHHLMPMAVEEASTGIIALDKSIQLLQHEGYMHNHVRMYIASLSCNIAGAHWLQPARWMYYHLLDADVASNYLSWQWVAGTFSNKKYYCNQENINRFTEHEQHGTFLDVPYEGIEKLQTPESMLATSNSSLKTNLFKSVIPKINVSKPVIIYNAYNLDPHWRIDEDANRILLLEPSHFNKFPVSEKFISFILALAENIKNIQVVCGEISDLKNDFPGINIIAKEHPVFKYPGADTDERDWMFPQVQEYYSSFSAYWKNCRKFLHTAH